MIIIKLVLNFGFYSLAIMILAQKTRNMFAQTRNSPINGQFLALFLLFNLCFWVFGRENALFGIGIAMLVSVLSVECIHCYAQTVQKRLLEREMRLFFDRLIIEIRSGKSFRRAMTLANHETDAFVQQKIQKMLECLMFSVEIEENFAGKLGKNVFEVLKLVDSTQNNAVFVLDTFREQLLVADEFRHKSGQIQNQIRFQSIFLSLLYFALLVFVVFQFEFSKIWKFVFISVTFFVTGFSLIFFRTQRFSWKI